MATSTGDPVQAQAVRWKAWALLGLVLFELAALREMSAGRFWLLSASLPASNALLLMHTVTKVTAVGVLALVFVAIIEQRYSDSRLLPISWRWPVLAVHICLFIWLAMMILALPSDRQVVPFTVTTGASYLKSSLVFLSWQVSALLLLAPVGLISRLRPLSVAFLFIALGSALILSTNSHPWLSAVENALEGTTLTLSLLFYGIIGNADPMILAYEGGPVVQVGQFAVLVGTACAGYQGMLASAAIMCGLIVLEWSSLRRYRAMALALGTVVLVFILNSVRVGLLLHIGEAYSEDIAVNGFHSYFGTLSLLLVVAAAMLALQLPSFRMAGAKEVGVFGRPPRGTLSEATGRGDILAETTPYLVPLAAYLCILMVLGLFTADFNWLYPVAAVLGGILVFSCRGLMRREFKDGVTLSSFAVGVLVFVIWIFLVPQSSLDDTQFASALNAVPVWLAGVWIIFRLLGSSIVVPVLEELAFRAGLLRLLDGLLRPYTGVVGSLVIAIAGSSLVFGALHSSMIAGTVAGICYAVLTLRSGRVGDAIIAHAVTNFLIALVAIGLGRWSLW